MKKAVGPAQWTLERTLRRAHVGCSGKRYSGRIADASFGVTEIDGVFDEWFRCMIVRRELPRLDHELFAARLSQIGLVPRGRVHADGSP